MPLACIAETSAARLLDAAEIHVWTATVSDWLPHLGELADVLDASERERAARFRFEKDRRRFSLCRGLLRGLLGCYISVDAKDIEFRFGDHDKPELLSTPSPRIEFNVSHSDEAAYFAFAANKRVGVDVERMRPTVDVHGLGQQVFTARELALLSSTPEPEKVDLFFSIWTQKEAYIKAVGLGLSAPVREITVGDGLIPRGEEAGIGIVEDDDAQWSLVPLEAPAGYKAALAVEGRIRGDSLRVRPLLPSE